MPKDKLDFYTTIDTLNEAAVEDTYIDRIISELRTRNNKVCKDFEYLYNYHFSEIIDYTGKALDLNTDGLLGLKKALCSIASTTNLYADIKRNNRNYTEAMEESANIVVNKCTAAVVLDKWLAKFKSKTFNGSKLSSNSSKWRGKTCQANEELNSYSIYFYVPIKALFGDTAWLKLKVFIMLPSNKELAKMSTDDIINKMTLVTVASHEMSWIFNKAGLVDKDLRARVDSVYSNLKNDLNCYIAGQVRTAANFAELASTISELLKHNIKGICDRYFVDELKKFK